MPLSHKQARQWIEKAADGLLDAEQQAALDEHLKGCAECRAFAAELAALEGALGVALSEHIGQPKLTKAGEQNLVKSLQERFGAMGAGGPPRGPFGKWPWWAVVLVLGALGVAGALVTPGVINWLNPSAGQNAVIATDTATQEMTATPSYTFTATLTATHTSSPAPLILVAVPIQNANCRDGASNAFEIADTLFGGEEYSPIGRGFDNVWIQFVAPVNLTKCWAFIGNLDLLIDGVVTPIEEVPASLLPFVPYPPTPTPTSTPTRTPTTILPQCSDGIDNDQDGAIDYGKDKDCRSPSDDSEWD